MGLRTAILEKSKAKSQTSSGLPTTSTSTNHHVSHIFHLSSSNNNNGSKSTGTSSDSTPRSSSQAVELDPDSFEAFLLKAERDERERLEVIELENRIRKRTESWGQEKRPKDGGTRAWLIGNGLSK